MFDDVKKYIDGGDYDLADLLHRIDVLYVEGKLNDDKRDQLIEMAREKSKPTVDDESESIIALTMRIQSLEERMDAVEGKTADEWPNFEEGHIYKQGDQVTFSGKHYKMVLPGEVMASPSVYPDAWKYVEDAPATDKVSA